MPNESTPGSVLDRLRHNPRDRESLARLMDFCQGYFLCWARRFFGNDHHAEDFLQELFLKVFQRLPTFEYDRNRRFRGWLFTIAKNLAIETKEKVRRQATDGLQSSDAVQPECVPDFIESEFRACVGQRARDVIRRDFEPSTWQAFERIVLEGQSAREVAEALGMTVAAVYMAKSRVLNRLRAELQDMTN